jgi:hypothetical protein
VGIFDVYVYTENEWSMMYFEGTAVLYSKQ